MAGLIVFQLAMGLLAFFWPKLRGGGFGGKVNAGNLEEIRSRLFQSDGTVSPLAIPGAQAYLVPFQGDSTGGPFGEQPVIAGGVMALWQRCVHLGCRVPVCGPSQGFECPCHASRYNFHGEYEDGPAPRNMDRFVVEIDDAGDLVIDTGRVVQTPKSKQKTAAYPQGPACVDVAGEQA